MSMKENGRNSGHEQTEYFGVISFVVLSSTECEAMYIVFINSVL